LRFADLGGAAGPSGLPRTGCHAAYDRIIIPADQSGRERMNMY
jgi:hypothetical protein